jgi:hypothetical protein
MIQAVKPTVYAVKIITFGAVAITEGSDGTLRPEAWDCETTIVRRNAHWDHARRE